MGYHDCICGNAKFSTRSYCDSCLEYLRRFPSAQDRWQFACSLYANLESIQHDYPRDISLEWQQVLLKAQTVLVAERDAFLFDEESA